MAVDSFCCPHCVHSPSPTWSPDFGWLYTLCMDPWTTCGFLEESSRNPQVVPTPLTGTSLLSSCGRISLWKLWINSMWTSCPQGVADPVDAPVDNLGIPQVWISESARSARPQAVSDTPVDDSDTPTSLRSGSEAGKRGVSMVPNRIAPEALCVSLRTLPTGQRRFRLETTVRGVRDGPAGLGI